MSNSRNFIISRIEKIAHLLPDIQFRYEHREIHDEHIIEVSPKCFYDDGSRFEQFETELYSEFLDLFPEETILVIPPEDVIKINNVTYKVGSITRNWVSFKDAGLRYDFKTKFFHPEKSGDNKFNFANAA